MTTKQFGPSISPEEIDLKELIGEGCFGKVYKGTCRATQVAIKVPKKQNIKPKKLKEFLKEVEVMSKNYSPYINLFMGACTVPGKVMIVTELMETDLEKLLADKSKYLSLYQRMRMAKDAAQGVAWLHGATPALIHRDLKTSNLLVDKNGVVKVCDFGLAQLCEKGEKYMDEDGAKGTPLYMAPEILAGEEFGESSDVYSFAIVLWEILTRKEAFAHHNDYDTFLDAVCVNMERPPIPEDCLPSIKNLLEACWNDNPNVRPTFPQIVQALDEIMVEAAIPDEIACKLWKQHFLKKENVPWTDFIEVLGGVAKLGPQSADELEQLTEVACLKALLVEHQSSDNPKVNIQRFGKICGCFGPFQKLISTIVNTLESGWFFGDSNAVQAQSKLADKSPGTFLLRFSSNPSTPYWFTISLVTSKRQIRHDRIMHSYNGKFIYNKRQFSSLASLVSTLQAEKVFTEVCPDHPFQHLFTNTNESIGYNLYD